MKLILILYRFPFSAVSLLLISVEFFQQTAVFLQSNFLFSQQSGSSLHILAISIKKLAMRFKGIRFLPILQKLLLQKREIVKWDFPNCLLHLIQFVLYFFP